MTRQKLKDIDLDKFSEKMHSESDRACAILGAALLDAKLENIFNSRLLRFQPELLSNVISTFSARIKLANALSWISDPVQKDLDIIRKIRNDFAHSFDHELSFHAQSVEDRCKNLRVAQTFIDGFDDSINAPDQDMTVHGINAIKDTFKVPRWRFQLSVNFISQYLDDIPDDDFQNQGSSFLNEVHDLSANFRVRISGTLTVVNSEK